MSDAINQTMNEAVNEGIFPSAQLLVVSKNKTLINAAYGNATLDTIFDVASLTKPISTTTLVMQLVVEDKIRLNDTLPRLLSRCNNQSKDKVTIRHLLSHSSGLPSWQPFYQTIPTDDIATPEGKLQIIEAACLEPLISEPGYQSTYSDIGFILLGEVIENLTGKSISKLFSEKIARPLGLNNTFFIPLSPEIKSEIKFNKSDFAPTEHCPWRRKVLQGEVHDQNCYAMGGVAGHAGLFSNTKDINKFITEFVASLRGTGNFLPQDIAERFLPFKYRLTESNSTWLLGWDRPSHIDSAAGVYFSPTSIGHLGYTGCSMWIDLEKDFWIVLLTNRIHPTITNQKIKSFRPMLHNLIYEELIA